MKYLILASFISVLSINVSAQMIICSTESNSSIKNKETLLKTYTYDYWRVATGEIEKLPTSLQKKGFVVGDFHFNNVGIYYNYIQNTSELIINDFDDAGYNYLIIDILKYISFLKKVDKKIDVNAIIGSYIQGLSNVRMPPPLEINKILTQQQYEFTEDYMNYLNKKRIEAEEFEISQLSSSQKSNLEHFMNLRLLKRLRYVRPMFHVNSTGSSKGMERYEFVGVDEKGSYGIYEFKQLKCSASGVSKSQNLNESFTQIKNFFNINLPSNYMASQQMYFYNGNYYLVREKKNNPLKKLKISEMPTGQLQVYANFYSNFLGYLHSKSSDEAFLNAVRTHKGELKKISKKIAKEFNEEVQ